MPEGQGWVRANDDAALYVTNTIEGDYRRSWIEVYSANPRGASAQPLGRKGGLFL
ncbi:MAG: hypothetical protein U9Q78_07490 [Chloroflexota bacterium]|nr:hypothetical protein [Chloroflexota bacterium]